MIPQSFGLIRDLFPPEKIGQAFAMFGPIIGLSTIAGPIIAGLLIKADLLGTGWRMIFLINLLEILLRHPGKLVTRRQLLTEVWGHAYTTETNHLRVYMPQLRRKLEPDPARPRYLLTEPGMGYRYQP